MEGIIFLGLTHILIALTIYSLFFKFDIVYIFFIILGSLLPDIDTPKSKLGKYNLLAPVMKHRGRMHTLVTPLFLSFCLYVFSLKAMKGFLFGYILHLMADTLTPMGIMWLFPFSEKYYSLSTKENNLRQYEGLIIVACILWLFLGKGKGSII